MIALAQQLVAADTAAVGDPAGTPYAPPPAALISAIHAEVLSKSIAAAGPRAAAAGPAPPGLLQAVVGDALALGAEHGTQSSSGAAAVLSVFGLQQLGPLAPQVRRAQT